MRIMVIFDFPEIHSESISAARIIGTIEKDCSKIINRGESCWIDQIIDDDNEEVIE